MTEATTGGRSTAERPNSGRAGPDLARDRSTREGSTGGTLDVLAAEVAALAGPIDAEVATAAGAVAERLRSGRFEVAVVGAFNRGKSTLCNALVGADVLPTGVVPLTSVGTELRSGQGPPEVVWVDGSRRALAAGETVATFVTEEANPHNERGVARVVVPLASPLLEGGLVLVDTPGTGSVHRHNDVESDRQLLQADGAVVVLSADSPLTDDERTLLEVLRGRRSRTFYVCNRADHLTDDELAQVRRFVSDQIEQITGRPEPLWCVSARAGLAAALAGDPPEAAGGEWADFVRALTTFARRDLVGARHAGARHRLVDLCRRLEDRLVLDDATTRLGADALAVAVEAFHAAAAEQREGWDDDAALLRRDVAALADRLGDDLHAASVVEAGWDERLARAAEGVGKGQLARVLDDEVERIVRTRFDAVLRHELVVVDEAWGEIAEQARKRVEVRVNTLRQQAADAFEATLPDIAAPPPSELAGSFSYHFVVLETPTDQIAGVLRLLLPTRVLRNQLVAAARRRLARDLDKHAGRARVDLVDRVTDVGRRLEAAYAREVDAVVAAVDAAADRAEVLRRDQGGTGRAAERSREQARRVLGQVRDALAAVFVATEDGPGAVPEPAGRS